MSLGSIKGKTEKLGGGLKPIQVLGHKLKRTRRLEQHGLKQMKGCRWPLQDLCLGHELGKLIVGVGVPDNAAASSEDRPLR